MHIKKIVDFLVQGFRVSPRLLIMVIAIMALKKSKKKKKEQDIHKQIENEYLKKLEQAVSGLNGELPYIMTPREVKKKEQLKRLREWDPKLKHYTGRKLTCEITYKMPGGQFGISPSWCVLAIRVVDAPR